jgi:TRAP-type transport system periplasmic protein
VRALVTVALLAALSPAEPRVHRLHLAAVAPEGTDWARKLRAFAHDVETRSEGRLLLKWTLGGMGGDEPTLLMRVLRQELDGVAGAVMCERLAPSLRAVELVGLVSDERQAQAVLSGLRPQVEEEFQTTPFRLLFVSTGFGHRMLFSKRPVRSFADLQRGHWWVWELDDVLTLQLREMGVPVVPLPLDQALAAADEGRVDGFIVVPEGAIAFGMYTRVHFYTDLESAFLPGCLVMNARSFDALPAADRALVTAAAARLKQQFEDSQRDLESHLDGALVHEGLRRVAMSPAFRAALFAAGRAAIDSLGDKLAPRWLVEETRALVDTSR